MSQENLYLVIRTNRYTGNFERELLAYVFGITDEDEYAEDELEAFREEVPEGSLPEDIYDYYDYDRRGRSYSEYHGYFIDPSPDPDSRECDSIYIAMHKKFSDAMWNIYKPRLDAYAKSAGIEIVSTTYYNEVYQRAS